MISWPMYLPDPTTIRYEASDLPPGVFLRYWLSTIHPRLAAESLSQTPSPFSLIHRRRFQVELL